MTEQQVSEILLQLPTHISDVVAPWAKNSPDQLALVEASGSWTYSQLGSVIEQTKAWLRTLGVRPGDRVVIVCENCRAFVAIALALASLDAWPVLVNARLAAGEIDAIREHCGARRTIYTTAVSQHAMEHAKRDNAEILDVALLGLLGVGHLSENVKPEPPDPEAMSQVSVLIYTSGTTGLPKGVMLTHRNLLFVAAISARIRALTPNDRLYGILPMSHAVGLSVVLLGALISGATLYLSPRFDPITVRAALEKDRITVALGVPAMFIHLLGYAKLRGFQTLTLPDLRIISSSGAPLDPAVKAATEKLFGMPLYNGYGVTECSPNIAQARIEEPRSDASVGRVFPGIEVKFVGADRNEVAEGEVGELWVRGPNVMKGYYRAKEETAAAIDPEGWFNTRDLARLVDGHLFIVGRTKELIVRFGFNVYPAEVEAVLNSHPAVARSAVIGRTAKGDEEVVAFVQLSPGSALSTLDLEDYAAGHLAPYKRPSQIILLNEMPLTPTGKVRKDELAKMVSKP